MTPSKKRPRTRLDPEKRRAQLLECALSAVAKHGVARATHSHVAASAGVSVSAVYSYFRTREELIDATLHVVGEFLERIFSETLQNKKSAYEELVDLARVFSEAAKERPDLVKVWLDWTSSVENEFWPHYLRVQAGLRTAVRQAIRRAQREGIVPIGIHVPTAARLYIGGGHTIALIQFEGISKPDLERFLRHMAAGALGVGAPWS